MGRINYELFKAYVFNFIQLSGLLQNMTNLTIVGFILTSYNDMHMFIFSVRNCRCQMMLTYKCLGMGKSQFSVTNILRYLTFMGKCFGEKHF